MTAVKITFEGSGGSEVFTSGADMKWVGEAILDPRWEKTDFYDVAWKNAIVYSTVVGNASWPPERLAVAAKPTSPQMTAFDSTDDHDSKGQFKGLQPAALAGIVVGAVLLAALTAVVTFLLTRRRYQSLKKAKIHSNPRQGNIFTQASAHTERDERPPAYMDSRSTCGLNNWQYTYVTNLSRSACYYCSSLSPTIA
jgi:hypothetical protein